MHHFTRNCPWNGYWFSIAIWFIPGREIPLYVDLTAMGPADILLVNDVQYGVCFIFQEAG